MTSGEERSDELLCGLAIQGDEAAEETLACRYGWLVKACARPHVLVGGDSEDLIQEGMIGLLSAIRTFRPDRDASFATYARVCIHNRIAMALRSANRDKHIPLNSALPLFQLPQPAVGPGDPEDDLINREEREGRWKTIADQLSPFEQRVLRLYLKGLSYGEIAACVGKPLKAVDNAVQRIRRKAARQLSSGDLSKG